LSEVQGIARGEIYSQLKKLKDAGVHIVIVAPVEDKVFPMKELQKRVVAGDLDGVLSTRGGHGDFTRLAQLFTDAIMQIFLALEEKEKNRHKSDGEFAPITQQAEPLPASSTGVGE
jgi:hypothetical protein